MIKTIRLKKEQYDLLKKARELILKKGLDKINLTTNKLTMGRTTSLCAELLIKRLGGGRK